MRKALSLVLAVLLAACLGGCAMPPSQEEIAKADYGPFPPAYQEMVKSAFSQMLKDPYSAVYEFHGDPVKGYYVNPPIKGGGVTYGWCGNVSVNAKNSYGGYTGSEEWFYVIRNFSVRVLTPRSEMRSQ